MLSKSKLEEIRKLLENSQNPLFFFDNDADGLCSFLILQRALGRGKGVAVKSFPDLNSSYLRKVNELNPDYVVILDKPRVEKAFIEGVYEKAIPIIWIDHHDVQVEKEILEKTHYFNSYPSSEPVTYICYNVFKKESDMWLAMIGCIGDVYMPDFASKFCEKYPELFNSEISAFDSLFTTEVGKAVKMFNFVLKDTTTNVIKFLKFLMKANNLYDILEENSNTKGFHERYNQLKAVYDKIIKKAEANISDSKLLFFSYSGETSMSAEISNELFFKYKNKLVVVAFRKQDKANISIRGENARKFTLKAIDKIEGATGGGHETACGVQVPIERLDEFNAELEKLVN